MRDPKSKYKVYTSLVVIFAAIVCAALYMGASGAEDVISGLIVKQAQTASRALEGYLQNLGDRAQEKAGIIAESENIISAVKDRDDETLLAILRGLSSDMDYVAVLDASGTTIAKNHSDTIGGDLSGYSKIASIEDYEDGVGGIGFFSDIGLLAYASAGIYSGDEVVGTVVCGYDLSSLALLDGFARDNACEASVFLGGERINTTARSGGNSPAGPADPKIIETVIGKKTVHTGRLELSGAIYHVHYSPIISGGHAIGMLYTSTDISAAMAQQRNIRYVFLLVAAAVIAASGIFLFGFGGILRRHTKALADLAEKEKSLEVLENVLNAADIGLYATDPLTDKILYANKALLSHLNTQACVEGEYCWKVFQTGMTKRCDDCSLAKLIERPSEVVEWETADAAAGRYFKNTGRLIDWPDGKKVHFCQRMDITEAKQAMEKDECVGHIDNDNIMTLSEESLHVRKIIEQTTAVIERTRRISAFLRRAQ